MNRLSVPDTPGLPGLPGYPTSHHEVRPSSMAAQLTSQPKPQKPIRVLLWSPGGSGEHYHGPGSFSYRLYSSAAPGRFEITLVHGFRSQKAHELFQAQHLLHPLGGALATWQFVRKGREWLVRNAREFDVFHGLAGFQATVAPAFEAQKLGLPAAIFIASHLMDLADKGGWKAIIGMPRRRRKMVKSLSAVIAMSQAIYDEMIGYGIAPTKIARIPMGVDCGRFHPVGDESERRSVRRQLGWKELPTLVFAGGITDRKRPHLLVEALGVLKSRGLECQLAMIGPDHQPQYTQHMKQRAGELKVDSQIIWFGFTEDIAPLLRAGDFFALPSANEGMPAALVEAMASGLPSIVTAISGNTDLVGDNVHGRIVQPDADDIAAALAVYLNDSALARRQGLAAREKVVAQFSTTVVLDEYERMFRRMMAGQGVAG
ncbi:MAG: glycosyltransferase family 4 protein [Phycisphaerales bacterium]|nr:glycosyltransferase family 4 protein [Phycisphaerales bacterium]